MFMLKHPITLSVSLFFIVCIAIITVMLYTTMVAGKKQNVVSSAALDHKKIIALLSTKSDKIDAMVVAALKKVDSTIIDIIQNPTSTLEKSVLLFDRLEGLSDAAILSNIFEAMSLLHSDQNTREKALAAKLQITEYFIEHVAHNQDLFAIINRCYQAAKIAGLDKSKLYCIEKIIENFERNGIQLPKEKQKILNEFFKEAQKYMMQFEQNINSIVTTIEVKKEQLDGLAEQFIDSLSRTEAGLYILTLDYPVYFTVMENCKNAETRKKMFRAFNNRGYPDNEDILSSLIASRNNIAKIVGFETYAQYDIANQMAKEYQTVEKFLEDLYKLLDAKLIKEYEILQQEALDIGITLSPQNTLYPWDILFLTNAYKKKNFNLDELVISEYFPMHNTVAELLGLYESFFGIVFEKITPDQPLYDQEVIVMRVKEKKKGTILGHILFDLYPRQNKFSHAAHLTLVPSVLLDQKNTTDYISVVIANFPKETVTQPSLLKRADVKTFFHELGHALHALFGKTEFSTFSGTNTKWDFVEMPSQMLEEWLYDKTVLKKISKHYKTGDSLPDNIIDQIIRSKNIFSALNTVTQIYYAFLSLTYYNTKGEVNLLEIAKDLRQKFMPMVWFDPENHSYASFGHLGGYGAKYYGYLYSNVFAIDIFSVIKTHGLFNSEIGEKYRKMILTKGGSVDPEIALIDFLGRKPSIQPFIDDLFQS